MTAISGANPSADSSLMAQSISAAAQDVHDLFSTYGEFLPSGNDPTIGQNSTIRHNNVATASGSVALERTGAEAVSGTSGGIQP